MKYIIKNCPALDDQARCMAGHVITGNYLKECEFITTCLIKQTYEKVKNCQCAELMNNFDIEECE